MCKKAVFFIFVFVLTFLLNSNSQSFTFVKASEFDKINNLVDTISGMIPKIILIEDDPILLYNKGIPASDVKLKTATVARLQGFSSESYDFVYKQETFNLPYLKIRYENASYWINGVYPFVFDDAHPDAKFKIDDKSYSVFSARNIKFLSEDFYVGFEPIIIKDNSENNYKLLISNSFPEVLQGHSYGSKFAYLQNDMGVVEKITSVDVENNFVILNITATYQEGGATYIISFKIDDNVFMAEYGKIQLISE